MFLFDFGGFTTFDDETIVVKEFFAGVDIAQGFEKDAVTVLRGFQIRFAGVIDPLSGVAIILGVDDMAFIQVKVKSVVGLAGVVGVAGLGLAPGDDLALVLQHPFADLDGTKSINALPVNTRFSHLCATATGWLPPTVRSLPDGGFEAVFGLRHLIKTFTDNRDYLLLMAVLC